MTTAIPFISPILSTYFVDKSTGLPLSGGIITFYQDNARSILQPIYELSGSPPNYSYTVLPNPLILSSVGTIIDTNNNEVLPFIFPYEGSPGNTNGQISQYYFTVYNSQGQLQYTVEGFPFGAESGIETNNDIINYIPNGQFVLNNNIPAVSANDYTSGQVYQNQTILAPGGWNFNRSGSTGQQNITFERISTPTTSPESNPRYALIYNSISAGSDTIKVIEVDFPNITTFSSSEMIFYFYADVTTIVNVSIVIHYYYGSDVGTNIYESVSNLQLNPDQTNYQILIPFSLSTLQQYDIGNLNDDYVGVGIQFPNSQFIVTLTDFALILSTNSINAFPIQTAAQQMDQSTAGWLPYPNNMDENGFNLALPIIRGISGFTYDYSQIAKIFAAFYTTSKYGELLCDGTLYSATGYSNDLIPYQRLGSILWNSTITNYIFGTGNQIAGYYTAFYPSSTGTATLRIIQNKSGSVTTFTDVPTSGFTASQVYLGITTPSPPYNCSAFILPNNTMQIISTYIDQTGNQPTITTSNSMLMTGILIDGDEDYLSVPSGLIQDIYQLMVLEPASSFPNSGTSAYFSFYVPESNLTSQQLNTVYYKIGTSSQPSTGATNYIEVFLEPSTDLASDIISKTITALSNLDTIELTAVSGMSLQTHGTGKSFLLQDVTGNYKYQYWFQTGTESAPLVSSGYTLVEIKVSLSDTPNQVAQQLLGKYANSYAGNTIGFVMGINTANFCVPDLRGWAIRGNDPTGLVDTQSINRFSNILNYSGANIGTFQLDILRQHYHAFGGPNATAYSGGGGHTPIIPGSTESNTSNWGTTENLIKNISINWMIKY